MAWSGNSFGDFTSQSKGPSSGNRFRQSGPQQYQQRAATGLSLSSGSVAKLETLNVGSTATVVGVVISKEAPRGVFTKGGKQGSGKDTMTEKYLLNLVLRDSPTAFVNCTCWGMEAYIRDLARSFSIGDVVKLENCQVLSKPTDGSEEKFRVSTPVGFSLRLNENHSSIALYDGMDLGSYAPLQYIPVKPSHDFYSLEDVMANGQNLNGEHINLLVAVRKVGPARDITTKTGKHTKRCEVKLFDESCPYFPLVLWGEELCNLAQTWTPSQTVLFVADVRMNYDDFRSGMIATADSKTVFTTNPDTDDARIVFQYAQTQNFSCDDDPAGPNEPALDQIKDVVVVEQILSNQGLKSDYCLLYGVITKFDIDTDNPEQFFRRKCSKCKQAVYQETGYQCTNPDCSHGALSMFNTSGQVSMERPEVDISVPISVSDHTGTVNTRLPGLVLEALTGCKNEELMCLPPEERTIHKWNCLMERYKFALKVTREPWNKDRLPRVRVLTCSLADPADMEPNISR